MLRVAAGVHFAWPHCGALRAVEAPASGPPRARCGWRVRRTAADTNKATCLANRAGAGAREGARVPRGAGVQSECFFALSGSHRGRGFLKNWAHPRAQVQPPRPRGKRGRHGVGAPAAPAPVCAPLLARLAGGRPDASEPTGCPMGAGRGRARGELDAAGKRASFSRHSRPEALLRRSVRSNDRRG